MPNEPDNAHRTTVEATVDDRTRRAITEDIFCPQCTYNLRGLTADRCPECGLDISHVHEGESQIPWVHRREIGRIRAYWKTVWQIGFTAEVFDKEFHMATDRVSAMRFSWITIAHAYLSIAATWGIGAVVEHDVINVLLEFGGYLWLAVVHFSVFACLVASAQTPHYSLRRKDVPLPIQYRAANLMLYAAAPLAWITLVPLLALLAAIVAELTYYSIVPRVIGVVAGILVVLSLSALWMCGSRVVKCMLGRRAGRFLTELRRSAIWLLAIAVAALGLPVAYILIVVLVLSP